jgi:lipoprotein-releasing system permease protein
MNRPTFQLGLLLVRRSVTRRFGKAAIAFAGVALAIAALVLLEAIMEGVSDTMVRNSVAIHHGDINATWQGVDVPLDDLRRLPGVRRVLPRLCQSGVLARGETQASLMLYAVEPELEAQETAVPRRIVEGRNARSTDELLVGRLLAEQLGARLGDTLEFWQPGVPPRRFQVCGLFRTGIELLDGKTAYTRRGTESGPAASREIAVFTEPGVDPEALARRLRERLGPGVRVTPWTTALTELVQLIALNHVAMNVVHLLALVVLGFGVSNTVFISVSQRTRELGLLKAMGFTPGGVAVLVLTEVLLLVLAAGLCGAGLGCVAVKAWGLHGLDLARWTSEYPHFVISGVVIPRLTLRGLLLPGAVALCCGLVAALLPARRAGRLSVIEALRGL